MGIEKRKNARKAFENSAFIVRDGGARAEPCIVQNISRTGARIACTTPQAVPEQFVLRLSADGKVTRDCLVVWRRGFEVGVMFHRPARASAPGRPQWPSR